MALYALASDRKPIESTPLYYAPFFNIYRSGKVCVGTVDVHIASSASLEAFMAAWEHYFSTAILATFWIAIALLKEIA